MYEIVYDRKVPRVLDKIPQDDVRKIREEIHRLKENPRPHGCKKLKGMTGLYRLRSGDYRIVYFIEENKVKILIVSVKHRKDVYRDM